MLRKFWWALVCSSLLSLSWPGMAWQAGAWAAVDWEMVQSLNLDAEPLDAVSASDGSHFFVLTRVGEVVIFDSQGHQKDTIAVGREVKALRMGPTSETLLLLAPDQHQVRMIELSFIQTINILGNPFKGNPAAPVTIAVFSDFQ